jgi:hypothetical protein
MKQNKFKNLLNKEIFNELKGYIPFEFPHPTKDCCKLICNDWQLKKFIDEFRNRFWFADAIGYRITKENKLEFMWDADTHKKVITERKEYYDKKAEFIAKWGCE